jgi:hypothetical protein
MTVLGADWLEETTTAPAAQNYGFGIAYDAARRRIVMFGGIGSCDFAHETWLFDGDWSAATPGTVPQRRDVVPLAYDPIREQVVMFGGRLYDGVCDFDGPWGDDETWLWDGTDWTLQSPAHTPHRRAFHNMAWDPVNGGVLMFSGLYAAGPGPSDAIAFLDDAWLWDGTDWTDLTATSMPPARGDFAMATHSAENKILVFGGVDDTFALIGDTWTWDGVSWTAESPAHSPAAREQSAAADWPPGDSVLLTAGDNLPSGVFRDTWLWDGTDWTEETPATDPIGRSSNNSADRTAHGMAWDSGRNRVTMFGNAYSQTPLPLTWSWVLPSAASIKALFGLGH